MVWVCTLAAISSSLYAVDGVVLIDQNRALAGSVTPGDAPGFPVTLSQPGSYRRSGNLTVPDINTTAIQITADNVSLDLNGFSIIGPNVCTTGLTTCAQTAGVGVRADDSQGSGPPGVRVFNGTVRGMGGGGIRTIGKSSAVERVNALGNGDTGIFVVGSVTDSVANLNGGSGIVADSARGCAANQNRLDSIFVTQGSAIGNTASLNGRAGFLVVFGSAVTGNAANANKTFGIDADCPSSIVGNANVGNQQGSIRTNGVCTLANNTP
jgi:hypothetical protein